MNSSPPPAGPLSERVCRLIKGQAHCVPGLGPPTSLMSNWDSCGDGEVATMPLLFFLCRAPEHQVCGRLGQAGSRSCWAKPPAASVMAAGGPGSQVQLSWVHHLLRPTGGPCHRPTKQTSLLVCKPQRFLSARRLGVYAQWRAFGIHCMCIHSFTSYSFNIHPAAEG